MPTVGEIVRKTTEFFQAKSETARLDSELLIGKALGLERLQVFLKHDLDLTEEQLENCRALVRRRSKGEPVAYILGEKGFYKHSFEVTAATLIPRPETEMLVVRGIEILQVRLPARGARPKSAVQLEIAAAALKREEADRATARSDALAAAIERGIDAVEAEEAIRALAPASEAQSASTGDGNRGAAEKGTSPADVPIKKPRVTIVDLGCGTGCIGLSIADEIKDRADLRLVFVDISTEALEVARRNAVKLGLDAVSEFVKGDAGDIGIFANQIGLVNLEAAVDLVVANPPYIDPADSRVEPNVRLYEPHTALFADESGLAEIRRWSVVARKLARETGSTLFEIGDGQGADAIRTFEKAGWDHVKLARDLSNRERMVEATGLSNAVEAISLSSTIEAKNG